MNQTPINTGRSILSRAQGCLLGQLAGDALGSLVEFWEPPLIRREYPEGVRDMADGGSWNTIAGQPTDDSEMALSLARVLADHGRFDVEKIRDAYFFWYDSRPFDCGSTISSGLRGRHNPESQANGALMRISPLGIFGASYDLMQVAYWARQDSVITHIHPVCQQANALFAMAIAHAVRTGVEPRALHEQIVAWADEMDVEDTLMQAVNDSMEAPPADYLELRGWVLVAFQNALWQLRHAPNLEEGVVNTIMHGGDTDTNAAICGALLGAVWGREAVPARWTECLLNCRPAAGQPHVHQPRPECFWPVDTLELAEKLVTAGVAGRNGGMFG